MAAQLIGPALRTVIDDAPQPRRSRLTVAGLTGRWVLRLRVRCSRRALDREIANGAALDASPARSLRALELSSASERRAIAAALANIVEAAEECQLDPGSRLIVDQAAVIAARCEIVTLIELLQVEAAADPRDVAAARLLVDAF